ncbi:MAG: hypothetical protein JXB35_09730 [Anaerolineae bacterium]|nr:hypothetical protein [Anaerolineae bacterium]
MANLLKNGGFEAGWWRKTHTGHEYGEIFVPEDWVAFWREGGQIPYDPDNLDGYKRPECKIINREPPFLDPPRIHAGNRAWQMFTFYGIHDGGLYQVVDVTPGATLRLTAFAHAWSSRHDDANVSDGVGQGAFLGLEGDIASSDLKNFTFKVGIDPTGGCDPWADSVIWGQGAHIYNVYAQIPPVVVTAQAPQVTAFVRSTVLWRFKHCDAYIDAAELTVEAVPGPFEVVVEPAPVRPRTLFQVIARKGAAHTALHLAFEGGEVLRGDPRVAGDDVMWHCLAMGAGPHTARVLKDTQVLGEFSFLVLPGLHPPR